MSDSYLYFLQDCLPMIIEQAQAAKRDEVKGEFNYATGKVMAYYEVLSLLRQQAEAFGIPLATINFDKFDPDVELI